MNVPSLGRIASISIACSSALTVAACTLYSASGPSGTYYSFSQNAAEAAASAPLSTDASPTYHGLTRDSYGSLTTYRTSPADDFSIRSCDPTVQHDPDSYALAVATTKFVLSPLSNLTRPDDSIQKLRLTEFFPVNSDILAGPLVAVIDPRPDTVTFWHESDMIPYIQVARAAAAVCRRNGKKPFYAGSATHCWNLQSQGKVKHPVTIYNTFAISEFQCKS